MAYAALVFIVLQVGDLTFEALGFPSWTYTFVVVLSVLGFPAVAGLAWAFDVTPEGLERTPEPGSSEPAAAVGRFPAVAMMAGATTVVLSIVLTWVITRPDGPPAFESLDPDVVAVTPFRVASSDPGLTYLREGALDLLAAKLTAAPRVVDPRTLMSAWRGAVGDQQDLPRGEALTLAGGLGAGRILLGSIVGRPESLRISAELLDVASGETVAETSLEGPADSIQSLLDGLAGRLIGAQVGAPLASITSTSVPAVRDYLDGQALFRRGEYASAGEAFNRALDRDSLFAAAAIGLWNTISMSFGGGDLSRPTRLAWAGRNRLSSADREYLRALVGANYPAPTTLRDQIALQERVVRSFPDRPEAWYELGDEFAHRAVQLGDTTFLERAIDGFRRALDLDPSFGVARQHLIWYLKEAGDPAWQEEARRFLSEYPTGETAFNAQVMLASADGASGLQQYLETALDSVPPEHLYWLVNPDPSVGGVQGTWPHYAEVAIERLERSAGTDSERVRALLVREDVSRLLGRLGEARAAGLERGRLTGRTDQYSVDLIFNALGHGDTTSVAEAVVELTTITGGPAQADVTQRPYEACALGLWAERIGQDEAASEWLESLRAGVGAPYETTVEMARQTCVLLLGALRGHRAGAADVEQRLDRLATWLDEGPAGTPIRALANLELSRIYQARGQPDRALSYARRRERSQRARLLATMVRLQGELHQELGNLAAAAESFEVYLHIRADPDPVLLPEVQDVRGRLDDIRGGVSDQSGNR